MILQKIKAMSKRMYGDLASTIGFSIMRSGDYFAAVLDEWRGYITKWLCIWWKIFIEEVDKENTTLPTLIKQGQSKATCFFPLNILNDF